MIFKYIVIEVILLAEALPNISGIYVTSKLGWACDSHGLEVRTRIGHSGEQGMQFRRRIGQNMWKKKLNKHNFCMELPYKYSLGQIQ